MRWWNLFTIWIADAIPSHFSTTSELSLIDQAKRAYGQLPKLSGVITNRGIFESKEMEGLNPQLACLVEERGRVFIYHGGIVNDEQTFSARMD
ncbi:cytosolic protein [Vibrio sp. MarTm2]|uniref:cytosolic protein n=1 Tax=Vibrio sp. MarTm2 TaxID=2998831 RepID=UPI0022CD7E23|nr:cytosolic protein [Vibrio sp. MarTm2]MDA0129372.1 cytosolic protein [Vibrio sp. MarTm2]